MNRLIQCPYCELKVLRTRLQGHIKRHTPDSERPLRLMAKRQRERERKDGC